MNKERVGSLIFLFAGIYGFIFSIQLPLGKMNEPGPGILPLSLSILLCISGTLWLIYGKGGGEEKTKIDLRGLMKKFSNPVANCGAHCGLYPNIGPNGISVSINSLPIFYFSLGFPVQTMGCDGSRHRHWGRKLVFLRETSCRPATKGALDSVTPLRFGHS